MDVIGIIDGLAALRHCWGQLIADGCTSVDSDRSSATTCRRSPWMVSSWPPSMTFPGQIRSSVLTYTTKCRPWNSSKGDSRSELPDKKRYGAFTGDRYRESLASSTTAG